MSMDGRLSLCATASSACWNGLLRDMGDRLPLAARTVKKSDNSRFWKITTEL